MDTALTSTFLPSLLPSCPFHLPSLSCSTSIGSLLEKLDYLRQDLRMPAEAVRRAVRAMPSLLVLSLDTLASKVQFLTGDVGFSAAEVGSLLPRAPALFFQHLQHGLMAKVALLREDVGLSDAEIRRVVLLVPRLLNFNIHARGRPLVAALTKGSLGVSITREQVRAMVVKSPSLLAIDLASDRFLRTFEVLRQAAGGGELWPLSVCVVLYVCGACGVSCVCMLVPCG
jgi:hypothetical protein